VKNAEDYGLPIELPDELRMKSEKFHVREEKERKKQRVANGEEPEPTDEQSKTKYPIEDSLLEPRRSEVPLPNAEKDFTVPNDAVSDLLMVWSFLQTFG